MNKREIQLNKNLNKIVKALKKNINLIKLYFLGLYLTAK